MEKLPYPKKTIYLVDASDIVHSIKDSPVLFAVLGTWLLPQVVEGSEEDNLVRNSLGDRLDTSELVS